MQRHQVTAVPPLQPQVTEHQRPTVACPHGQQQVRARLPDAVPTSTFGPRLTALAALLHGRARLSEREVGAVLQDVVGVTMRLGSVAACCERSAARWNPCMPRWRRRCRSSRWSTWTRRAGKRRGSAAGSGWVVSAAATVFRIAASRGGKVWQGLLGAADAGILTANRLAASNA